MNDIRNKKIVLIGGAGFIGHHLALAMKKVGVDVYIIDSLQVNNLLSLTKGKVANRKLYWNMLNQRIELLYEAEINLNVDDARNYNVLAKLIALIQPDVIVQLAAVAHANVANKDPHSTFDHSLRTLENALDVARDLNARFIYLSSSMVYGHFNGRAVTEETECRPLGIYGSLKYAGELIVKAYNQVFDLPYTIIRPSALYGERCISRRVGQIFIENALQDLDINIQGDGSDALDFTYIDDLTAGIIQIIESDRSINETFNLTFGEARTIRELSEIVRDQFPNIKINYLPKDKFTPDRGTLNVDKAKKLVGYTPRYPIELGFSKYIGWYKGIWEELNQKKAKLSDDENFDSRKQKSRQELSPSAL